MEPRDERSGKKHGTRLKAFASSALRKFGYARRPVSSRKSSRDSVYFSLCLHCRAIDFEDLFSSYAKASASSALYKHIATYTSEWLGAPCSLCYFLQDIIREIDSVLDQDESRRGFGPRGGSLYRISAGSALGAHNRNEGSLGLVIIPAWDHELDIPSSGFLKYPLILEAYTKSSTHEFTVDILSSTVNESQVDYGALIAWLHHCDTTHNTTCRPGVSAKLCKIPLRCIDCYTRTITEIKDDDTYLALSYVWGQAPVVQKDEQYIGTKLPEKTIRVVEDAIVLAKALGQRYLWVDQFCIDQQNYEIKKAQVQEMDVVYSRAYATIVACDGVDAGYGLAGISHPRTRSQHPLSIGTLKLLSTPPPLCEVLQRTRWNTRGWTYQEVVLSRRCIFFTEYQAYFVCPSTSCCEAITAVPLLNTNHVSSGTIPDQMTAAIFRYDTSLETQSPTRRFAHHVAEYSKRSLTFEADALDAFRGLLSRSGCFTFYGIVIIPSHELADTSDDVLDLNFLIWLAKTTDGCRRTQFPSWTWLGWRAELSIGSESEFTDNDLPRFHAKVQLNDSYNQQHSLREAIETLERSSIIPELDYSLIIESHVALFCILPQNLVCHCHPHYEHPGHFDTTAGDFAVAFFQDQELNQREYTKTSFWDCLLLTESKNESGYYAECLIIRWNNGMAEKVGVLKPHHYRISITEISGPKRQVRMI